MPPRSRWGEQTAGFRAGDAVEVVVSRGSRTWHETLVAARRVPTWDEFLASAGYVCALACGLIIGLRRPELKEARILALLMCAFAWPINFSNIHTPWLGLNLVLIACSGIPAALTMGLMAAYAALFGHPLGPGRRRLTWITYAAQALPIAAAPAPIIGSWTLWFDTHAQRLEGPVATFFIYVLPFILACTCVVVAFRCAKAAERPRLAWAMSALVLLYAFDSLWFELASFNGILFSVRRPFFVLNVAVPLTLTYSVLSRRVIDAGFALNRAAVFSATTLLLAGLFAGGQWLASAALSSVTARSPLLQLIIAVIVFYIVRFIRSGTEDAVSRIFFGARQRRIAAIREIAVAVDEVSDANAIPAFVVTTLREQAPIDAGVALDDGTAAFALISGSVGERRILENDPLVVRLRAQRIPITAGDGIVAIPMIMRKRLLGILFARAAETESEVAPDEISALDTLALRMTIAREEMLAEEVRRSPRHRIKAL